MTYEFRYLMSLFGAVATGAPVLLPEKELNWRRMFALAEEQSVLTIFCRALRDNPQIAYPVDIARPYMEKSFWLEVKYSDRFNAIVSLLNDMKQAGIASVVVKGFAVASCYAVPGCRISSDTDICVDPNLEEQACQFLKQRGFSVEPRWENGHHAVAKHPDLGVIEVHIRLYDELVEDVWFSKADPDTFIQQPYQQVDTPAGCYYTLGNTDHMLFIALHMVKHFIQSGMSLRMMMDVALFYAAHRDTLDLSRLWTVLRELKYDRLMSSVLWAMVHYCGLDPAAFPELEADADLVEQILTDLEKGGWLGNNDFNDRSEGWYEYNRQLIAKEKGKLYYWFYMLRWRYLKLGILFPGKDYMAREYPFVRKHGWLLPFAWIHRLFKKAFEQLTGAKHSRIVLNDEQIGELGKQRLELFRSLDML